MSAIQLAFTLRTSANVKTVHLLGSWDNYAGQLPLSKDSAKAGAWKGTFRFQGATLEAGQRYWYYYIMDGYHVSHDPAKPFTKEPTTGRQLNILDVPESAGPTSPASAAAAKRAANRTSAEIPKGRPISPSRIVHPKPSKPYASRKVREADYSASPCGSDILDDEMLAHQMGNASLNAPPSPTSSSVSSRSSSSSGGSSLSSLSDSSASDCRCNRWGITRKGDKVKLDCGGQRCGYSSSSSDESSECCSDSDEELQQQQQGGHQPTANARKAPTAPPPLAASSAAASRRSGGSGGSGGRR